MSEWSVIHSTGRPMTRQSIGEDLRAIGLEAGTTVIVHTSLSRIGWVCGAEVAVIQALMDAVTSEGTLVMPAHTGHLSDPERWGNPPVPEDWWDTIRDNMPAFDPAVTPTYGIGRIAEAFRTMPGVRRSNHPHTSFAAWGRQAEYITSNHRLDYGMGEHSPLARLYELDAHVLLIGVGYDSNTSFHLAEYRTPSPRKCIRHAPVIENGRRVWKAFEDIDYRTDEFERLGEAFELAAAARIRAGQIGQAPSKLFRQRDCVDFAERWLR